MTSLSAGIRVFESNSRLNSIWTCRNAMDLAIEFQPWHINSNRLEQDSRFQELLDGTGWIILIQLKGTRIFTLIKKESTPADYLFPIANLQNLSTQT